MRTVSIAGYVVWLAAAVALVVAGRVAPQRVARFGTLLDVVMASRPARIGLLLFWWWVGWHFLVAHPVVHR